MVLRIMSVGLLLSLQTYALDDIKFDFRNPISFVKFYSRSAAGISPIGAESNISYISLKNDILIQFDLAETLYTQNDAEIELQIVAELISESGATRPLAVPGYTSVTPVESTIVQNSDSIRRVDYRIRSNTRKNDSISKDIIDSEISISNEQVSEGDKVRVVIRNVSYGISYSKTFEIRSFGWKEMIVPSAVWLKTYTTGTINFQTAPSVTYLFYYDHEPNSNFVSKVFQPAYGIHGVIVDINQTKTVGLGISISWLARTTHIGTGIFLNSSDKFYDKTYYFIGVNFLQ